MSLVQRLPDNPLDIVGDVHGELDALLRLLAHLGYDHHGVHPERRKLVFVGDLCDRGPDSYGVITLVRLLMAHGNAYAILGNHEINLLINDAKDGSGWFFDERYDRDQKNYAPFERIPFDQRDTVRTFLGALPVVLVRDDIRIVHAAWITSAIDAIRILPPGSTAAHYKIWDGLAQSAARESGLYERYLAQKRQWALEDEFSRPPFLPAIADYEAMQQMLNPLKVLTSGVECPADTPFFAGNRWRFSDRVNWWDDYNDAVPVVIGHYWRLFQTLEQPGGSRYSRLFKNIAPASWHGKHRNVFCVDYSIGARWRDRKRQRPDNSSRFKLAALQWPENRLVFDSGMAVETT
ncbi:MAG: metallophosphoesterase [Candidimonas sp.]|nr:MAG: metallophosphoesterase [Candidimonas sp.]TAM26244.1 MAG: metallophosphoesterase [Candidimonas sp.]TAM80799.1 MAG: metallophosphoesterase [Candidimonas sp.]